MFQITQQRRSTNDFSYFLPPACWHMRCPSGFYFYLTPPPSFCSTPRPFSSYSALLSQKESLSFMMLASTAPPRNTMCLRLGGSSMRILNFYAGREKREQRYNLLLGTHFLTLVNQSILWTLKLLLIVSGCLRPAPSPGRAAWSLVLVWREGRGTWWSLLTGRCVYKSLPCRRRQMINRKSLMSSVRIITLCVSRVSVGHSREDTWGQYLPPGWC